MNITQKFITNNDCYKTNSKITPTGLMVHSTAAPGVMAEDFAKRWNKPGLEKATHFFVDDKSIVQILPCAPGDVTRAWHCGKGSNGSGNNNLVAFEICEPKDLNDTTYFKAAYKNAVELAAYLAKTFGYGADKIICHSEGHALGIASNHADVMHWFPLHGKDMDDFRADVADILSGEREDADIERTLYRVQVGAFHNPDYADALLVELQGRGFDDAYIKTVDGYLKVQVGAFGVESNATNLANTLETAGYNTYIVEVTTKPADVTYAGWPAVCNAQGVNVRVGAGTEYGILNAWPKLGKGNEVDVIGEATASNGKLWYKILIANEHEGYVFGEYLDRA